MRAKNDQPEPTPPTPDSLDATPRKKTTKSARMPSAKTKAASESPAADASAKAVAKPRRKSAAVATSSGPAAIDGVAVSDASGGTQLLEHEVRVRAYLLSLERGDRPGSPDGDWFQAEQEVALSRRL